MQKPLLLEVYAVGDWPGIIKLKIWRNRNFWVKIDVAGCIKLEILVKVRDLIQTQVKHSKSDVKPYLIQFILTFWFVNVELIKEIIQFLWMMVGVPFKLHDLKLITCKYKYEQGNSDGKNSS